ncbi:MAG: hypothetical protein IJV71_05670 [Lachnospiraceae bacterium]|nr:hypothetical protein [Lachnospiraceae bacterium]
MSLIKGAGITETELIFKVYQRLLLRDLKGVKEALSTNDYTTVKKLLNGLINDTEKDVEGSN